MTELWTRVNTEDNIGNKYVKKKKKKIFSFGDGRNFCLAMYTKGKGIKSLI